MNLEGYPSSLVGISFIVGFVYENKFRNPFFGIIKYPGGW